ncbi:MAG: type 1 glutamine amidotransferase [Elusimicrobiota bacterium]
MAPHILLLQIRNADDPMAGHEHDCFAKMCGVAPERIIAHNAVLAAPAPGAWRDFDAVMVGGAGDYSMATKPFAHHRKTQDFVLEVLNRQVPFFGSCMGFHIVAAALGGEVVEDRACREVGTFEIRLTPEGAQDPLFGKLPPSFHAHLGHVDRVARAPGNAVRLAESELVEHQAFRIGGGPAYCTQFHPELDSRTNKERYDFYVGMHEKSGGKLGYESTAARFLDLDPPVNLLKEFLKEFC